MVVTWRLFEGEPRVGGACSRVRCRPLSVHPATVISTERTGDIT